MFSTSRCYYLFVVHLLYLQRIVVREIIATSLRTHLLKTWVLAVPLLEIAHAEIVFIAVEQLFKACFCHIGQFYFGFARRGCRLIALGYILFSATSCLYHLIYGAISSSEIVLSEVEGDIVDYLCHLIDTQMAVMPMLGKKSS